MEFDDCVCLRVTSQFKDMRKTRQTKIDCSQIETKVICENKKISLKKSYELNNILVGSNFSFTSV